MRHLGARRRRQRASGRSAPQDLSLAGGVDDLDRLGELDARRDLDDDAVLHHRGIERQDRVAVAVIVLGGQQRR